MQIEPESTAVPQLNTNDALCRQHPSHLWDASIDGGKRSAKGESAKERVIRHRAAKAICEQCPLRAPCELAGKSDPLASGIWGGRLV